MFPKDIIHTLKKAVEYSKYSARGRNVLGQGIIKEVWDLIFLNKKT